MLWHDTFIANSHKREKGTPLTGRFRGRDHLHGPKQGPHRLKLVKSFPTDPRLVGLDEWFVIETRAKSVHGLCTDSYTTRTQPVHVQIQSCPVILRVLCPNTRPKPIGSLLALSSQSLDLSQSPFKQSVRRSTEDSFD